MPCFYFLHLLPDTSFGVSLYAFNLLKILVLALNLQGITSLPLAHFAVLFVRNRVLLLSKSWQSNKRDRLVNRSLHLSPWDQWRVSGRGCTKAESDSRRKVGGWKEQRGKRRVFWVRERALEPSGRRGVNHSLRVNRGRWVPGVLNRWAQRYSSKPSMPVFSSLGEDETLLTFGSRTRKS